ncbi:MAG: hypothetical protein WCE45_10915, partial [Sedimentisphaerales bacterium]
MKKLIAICAAMMLFSTSYAKAGSWTTFNVPGANDTTHISGIDGDNIVGYYGSSTNQHGFLYDGANWTTLDMPTAQATEIRSISG